MSSERPSRIINLLFFTSICLLSGFAFYAYTKFKHYDVAFTSMNSPAGHEPTSQDNTIGLEAQVSKLNQQVNDMLYRRAVIGLYDKVKIRRATFSKRDNDFRTLLTKYRNDIDQKRKNSEIKKEMLALDRKNISPEAYQERLNAIETEDLARMNLEQRYETELKSLEDKLNNDLNDKIQLSFNKLGYSYKVKGDIVALIAVTERIFTAHSDNTWPICFIDVTEDIIKIVQ